MFCRGTLGALAGSEGASRRKCGCTSNGSLPRPKWNSARTPAAIIRCASVRGISNALSADQHLRHLRPAHLLGRRCLGLLGVQTGVILVDRGPLLESYLGVVQIRPRL